MRNIETATRTFGQFRLFGLRHKGAEGTEKTIRDEAVLCISESLCRIRCFSFASLDNLRLLAPALLACLLIAGCTIGPNFTAPKADLPAGYASATSQPTSQPTAQVSIAQWWTSFNDPKLTELVERAFATNLDVQLAVSRIRQARATLGAAASDLGPTLDSSGSYTRSKAGKADAANNYQVGLDAGWEIDIFGGVKRNVESSRAALQSTVENLRDVQVSLAAEVAMDYINLRTSQQRIAIAKKNLETQKHSADLTQQKFDAGLVSGLDVANAKAQVASTSAAIPPLESTAHQTIYALSVLLNREPGALVKELFATGDIPVAPPAAPAGVPADLVRRRPDIRAAEADLHAATADIGVVVADLYPKVTIGGTLGFSAADAGQLFSSGSRSWSFGPAVAWNVFDNGKTKANIEVKNALQEQALLTWRQTVLTAMQEVENALIASTTEQEHRKWLSEAVAANRKATELATTLYAQGETDFIDVLSAQQSLFSSEDSLVQSNATMSTNLVSLYKALGGGWTDDRPKMERLRHSDE